MFQRVTTATHRLGGILDAVITSTDSPVKSLSVIDVGLSDHHLVRWTVDWKPTAVAYKTIRRRVWKNFKEDEFVTDLAKSSLCIASSPPDNAEESSESVDNLVQNFNEVMVSLLDKHAPDAHNVLQQQYADDTQLCISISAKTMTQNTYRLESCLSDLHAWFSHNWLALNPSKSEALLLGTSQRLKTLSTLSSVNVSGTTVPLTTQIKLLGVALDQSLSFDSHITALSKSCFYHIQGPPSHPANSE